MRQKEKYRGSGETREESTKESQKEKVKYVSNFGYWGSVYLSWTYVPASPCLECVESHSSRIDPKKSHMKLLKCDINLVELKI